jgi:hypothetical protein
MVLEIRHGEQHAITKEKLGALLVGVVCILICQRQEKCLYGNLKVAQNASK